MTNEERISKIMDDAEAMQNNCHAYAKTIMELANNKVSYQDAINAWMFYQLATIKYDIKELNEKIS